MIQVFQQLQGLANSDKFAILNRMVNGELKMEEVKKEDLGEKTDGNSTQGNDAPCPKKSMGRVLWSLPQPRFRHGTRPIPG